MNAVTEQVLSASEQWQHVLMCPACDSTRVSASEPLVDTDYRFGDARIEFPPDGIAVSTCGDCGLRYKTTVPAPWFVSSVMAHEAGKKWMEPYDFVRDAESLQQFAERNTLDLLDVGACSGTLLGACTKQGLDGRRSALDVVEHPGLTEHVQGEFIQAFIDDQPLVWSQEPYSVVTVLDVAEHLYSPRVAFENLRQLVKPGGYVVIETGDADSSWPSRYGIAQWWYVRLFEHHIFWSRASLEKIAREHGFQIESWQSTRHKTRHTMRFGETAEELFKVLLYRSLANNYPRVGNALGKYWTQPWSPFARDHFRVVLRSQA